VNIDVSEKHTASFFRIKVGRERSQLRYWQFVQEGETRQIPVWANMKGEQENDAFQGPVVLDMKTSANLIVMTFPLCDHFI
jgi:hypothetical protein